MEVVLELLAGAAALVVAVPAVLARARWRTRHPALALGLWCGAYLGGVALAVASLGCAVTVGLSGQAATTGRQPPVITTSAVVIFCWVGMAGVGALASLVLTRSEPMSADHRRTAALMTLLAAASAYRSERLGRVTVSYVDSDRPIAVSLPGRDPRIVVSSRLEDELTPGQLRAVIEHERAHLVWRHGWIALVAQLGTACTPGLSGPREFHRATRLLVELMADDAAARVCGSDDLGAALTTLAGLQGDEGMLLRARRAAARPASRAQPGARVVAVRAGFRRRPGVTR